MNLYHIWSSWRKLRKQSVASKTKQPHFTPVPRSCEKIPKIIPTLPLPCQGGGNLLLISTGLPSPPRGEGRVRGRIPIFSHLPPSEGTGWDGGDCFVVTPRRGPLKWLFNGFRRFVKIRAAPSKEGAGCLYLFFEACSLMTAFFIRSMASSISLGSAQ